ncbi:MAG: hypothetical protein H7Y42_10005 [Chitinophagaceae bacterium]|nr:hypothetical protein [Chitinophagaceae bacterium]
MNIFSTMAVIAILATVSETCGNKNASTGRHKAKLEIKALCMNYTIRLVEGNIDTSMITPAWTDEHSGKSYNNVFGLANPCSFPKTIKEGDEFYFTIDTAKQPNCAVCMAYYPTPPKKLSIKIVEP